MSPRGNGQADVDDEDPAVELEAGHVATDLTDASEEDDAAAGRQRRPASSSALRTRSRSSAVAGTSGRRGDRPAGPCISRAAFTGMGLEVTNSALYSGESASWILRAAADVAGLRSGRSSGGSAHPPGGRRRSPHPRHPGTRSRRSPSRRRSRPRTRPGPRRSACSPLGSRRWSPSPPRCWAVARARSACRARSAWRCGRGCCTAIIGSSVASAMCSKCAIRPRCGGLL